MALSLVLETSLDALVMRLSTVQDDAATKAMLHWLVALLIRVAIKVDGSEPTLGNST